MDLRNKTAIITGSGRGIGKAIALEFARQGAAVVCVARSQDEIEETARAIEKAGGKALAVPTDVTHREQVTAMVERTLSTFGQIDVLYNNAGAFDALGGLWEVDPAVWWHDVTVNVLGPMLACHAVLPHMIERNRGVIINMFGGGAQGPMAGGSGYGSSKAALLRLTDTLARELEQVKSDVLVFAMGPGFVRTRMTELQAVDPQGVRWLPFAKHALAAGSSRPPEDAAKASVELLRVACPQFNGRVFEVGMDFDKLAREADAIKERDGLSLRFQA